MPNSSQNSLKGELSNCRPLLNMKALGFQTYIWSSSIQIPLCSFRWSSLVVRLPPILWSSWFLQLGILVVFVRREEVSWCPNPIEQMARVLSLALVSPVVNGWGFRTSGTYRKFQCKRLRPSTSSTNNNPLGRVCVLRSVPRVISANPLMDFSHYVLSFGFVKAA